MGVVTDKQLSVLCISCLIDACIASFKKSINTKFIDITNEVAITFCLFPFLRERFSLHTEVTKTQF